MTTQDFIALFQEAFGKFHHSHEPVKANDGNHERVFSLRFPCVEEGESKIGGVIKIYLITN